MTPSIRARAVATLVVAVLSVARLTRAQTLAGPERPRVFTLADSAGSPVAVFVVRDSSFFSRVGDQGGWMSPSASCMAIAGKPPVVEPLTAFETFLRGWLADSTKHIGEAPPGVETTPTTDTATIAGVGTTRLRVTNEGDFNADMWVARALLPAKIRDAGDRWRALMPPDYWRRMHGSPGMTEITFTYGIPLRVRLADGKTFSATLSDRPPAWVAEVEQTCNAVKR